jgi:hypothetical protein
MNALEKNGLKLSPIAKYICPFLKKDHKKLGAPDTAIDMQF